MKGVNIRYKPTPGSYLLLRHNAISIITHNFFNHLFTQRRTAWSAPEPHLRVSPVFGVMSLISKPCQCLGGDGEASLGHRRIS